MKLFEKVFGEKDGKEVMLYHMEAPDGAYVEVLSYGAMIHSACMPDKNGVIMDVIGGSDDWNGYQTAGGHSAIVIGRFANRIATGGYTYSGKRYELEKGVNRMTGESIPMTMHGGSGNYSSKMFGSSAICSESEATVTLTYFDNGAAGFPGTADVTVRYTFTDNHELFLDYELLPTEDTPVSVTNHCYFNLTGGKESTVDSQLVKIHADFFTPNDSDTVPTGEIRPVDGTPFDFREYKSMKEGFDMSYDQIAMFGGFDHNFCINGRGYRTAVEAKDPESGRKLTVMTDLPGMQFYTTNGNRTRVGKNGKECGEHSFFCFETQNYPNSPNVGHFPNPFIPGGQVYKTRTAFIFSVEE